MSIKHSKVLNITNTFGYNILKHPIQNGFTTGYEIELYLTIQSRVSWGEWPRPHADFRSIRTNKLCTNL